MANIIVEYKKDKNEQGSRVTPYWLDHNLGWYDPDIHTFIGVVTDMKVKIPDTIIKFTKKTFVKRQLDLHERYSFIKYRVPLLPNPYHPDNSTKLTKEKVEEQAKEHWENKFSSYI